MRAIGELSSGDPAVQYRAISQLADWQSAEAVEPLRDLLDSEAGAGIRGRALVALAEIEGRGILKACLAHADDPEPQLRAAAAEALGIIRAPQGQAVVATKLEDPHVDVRNQALVAIATMRGTEAWTVVQPFLRHGDPKVLRYATRALGRIGDERAQAELVWLTEHPNVLVRLEAIRALTPLANPEAFAKLLERLTRDASWTNRTAAEEALAAYSSEVRRAELIKALRSDRSEFYPAAVRLLAADPDQEACDAIAELLSDGAAGRYRAVLPEALDILGTFNAERYQEVFLSQLQASDPAVRRRAVRYAAMSPNMDHFDRLRSAIRDPDPRVRAEALAMLAASTTAAPEEGILAYLADPLQSEDWETFRRAMELVAQRITSAELSRGFGPLKKILSGSDAEKRRLVARSLSGLRDADLRSSIAAAQGCATRWRIIGPFPSDPNDRGLSVAYPPEREIDFARGYPEQQFGFGAVFEQVDLPGGGMKALRLAAPTQRTQGRISARWQLKLPSDQRETLIRASLACESAGDAIGRADVRLVAGGEVLFRAILGAAGGVQQASLPLPAAAGGGLQVELIVMASGEHTPPALVVSQLAVIAGQKRLVDLIEQADEAAVTTDVPGRAGGEMRWRAHEVSETSGEIPLDALMPAPAEYAVAYAATELRAADAGPAWLHVETDDGAALWVNGAELLRSREKVDRLVPVQLVDGPNRVLLKVANRRGRWRCRLRVVDSSGARFEGISNAMP